MQAETRTTLLGLHQLQLLVRLQAQYPHGLSRGVRRRLWAGRHRRKFIRFRRLSQAESSHSWRRECFLRFVYPHRSPRLSSPALWRVLM
jgi:hypothetical protein